MLPDLCGKLEVDVEIKATAEKFHHMFKDKPHHIDTATDKVDGVELLEGQWGTVGSVIVWNYTHDGKPRRTKEIVEEIDDEKYSITFKVIDGDLTEHYKNMKISMQAVLKSDGQGSIVHWTVTYEKHHDEILDPHTFVECLHDVSKDLDAFLQES